MSRPRMSSTIRVSGRRGGPAIRCTRPQVEPSLVARTVETAFGRPGNHGTGQVRALLAEGHELARGQPHQQTGFVFVRVGEDDRPADGYIVDGSDPLHRGLAGALPVPVLSPDPHLSQRERGAGQHEKLHEVPALDVEILRPIDRKILPPGGLDVGGRVIRCDGDLLALDTRRVEARRRRSGETFPSRRIDRGIERATWIGTGVGHRYTSTSANGSCSTGALTTLSDTARLLGCSSIAAVTSRCGATVASFRGTMTYTCVVIV